MCESYEKDAVKSFWYFDNVLRPALKRMGVRQIYSCEMHDSELERFLDQQAGIDAIIVTGDNAIYPVAIRVQFGKCYKSFTIRRTRKSGAPTEFGKLVFAKAHGGLMPRYHLQLFIEDDSHATLGIVETEKLLNYIITHHANKWRETKSGESFYFIPWRDLNDVRVENLTLKAQHFHSAR